MTDEAGTPLPASIPNDLISSLLATALLFALPSPPPAPPDGGSLLFPRKGPIPGRQFDVPGAIAEVEIPGRMEALGTPVRVRAVKSTEPLPTLMSHFLREFRRAGLFIPPRESLSGPPRSGFLVGYDVRTRIGYTVFFQQNDDGTITVIQGEGHVGERTLAKQPTDFAPLFPGAHDVLRSEIEGSRTISYVSDESAAEVAAFYEAVLPKEGFELLEPGLFQRGPTQLRVFVRRTGEKGAYVLLTTQGSASPTVEPSPTVQSSDVLDFPEPKR